MIIIKYCTTRIDKVINSIPSNESLKVVLEKMMLLYSLSCLEKHLATFYQGGYCAGPKMTDLIRESILNLCSELKPEAIAIADALAPPDFVLNSILGMSDGRVSFIYFNSNFLSIYFICLYLLNFFF